MSSKSYFFGSTSGVSSCVIFTPKSSKASLPYILIANVTKSGFASISSGETSPDSSLRNNSSDGIFPFPVAESSLLYHEVSMLLEIVQMAEIFVKVR